MADWDRDGNQDLLVRHDVSGDLFLQAGTGVAKLLQPKSTRDEDRHGHVAGPTPFGRHRLEP